MRWVAFAAISAVALAMAGCTTPGAAPETAQCNGDPRVRADAKVAACTALIDSGSRSTETLAGALQTRCWAYEEKNERDAAIRDCDRAIELKPDFVDAYSSRATVYLNKGDFDRAIADYSSAIKLGARSVGIYSLRGMAYTRKGDYDRAIADYETALQIYPGFGTAEGGLQEAKEAKARLARGQALGDPRSWCEGKALPQEGHNLELQIPGCTKLIESGTEKRRDLARDYFQRAGAYEFAKRDYRLAIADYDRAIILRPDYAEAYFSRGVAHTLQGNNEDAIADFGRAIRLRPRQASYFISRGEALVAAGQFALAIRDFDRAIKLQPKNAEAFLSRCRAKIGKGDYRKAIADCDRTIKLEPVNGVTAAYDSRGDAHFLLHDWTKAIADYDRALKLWPEYPSALFGRGAAKARAGDLPGGQLDMAAAVMHQSDVVAAEAKLGIKP
jgi:tetratricopeptide (TPR) repeat protein